MVTGLKLTRATEAVGICGAIEIFKAPYPWTSFKNVTGHDITE
jgi:hypothetical protein